MAFKGQRLRMFCKTPPFSASVHFLTKGGGLLKQAVKESEGEEPWKGVS